jgi:hypothetical protein
MDLTFHSRSFADSAFGAAALIRPEQPAAILLDLHGTGSKLSPLISSG